MTCWSLAFEILMTAKTNGTFLTSIIAGSGPAYFTALVQVKKGKGFPYSLPSVGLGADPGVQAVSPQVTISHPPGGRLPLLSARRPAVTFPALEHHRP